MANEGIMQYPAMNNPVFVKFCRQPGTRTNDIFTDIEKGLTNRQLAAKYHCSQRTMEVYRRALEGRLYSDINDPGDNPGAGIKPVVTSKVTDREKIRDRMEKSFAGAPRIPSLSEVMYITDAKALADLCLERTQAESYRQASIKIGLSADMMRRLMRYSHMWAMSIQIINDSLGVNLYDMGLVKFREEMGIEKPQRHRRRRVNGILV